MSNSVYRIGSPYMKRRFKMVCNAMGWNCEGTAWVGSPISRGNVGYTFIQRAPHEKALYRVVQMVSASGGEKQLSSNYTSSELAAWFDGVSTTRDTLCKLHADMVHSVDSGRGNEKFAAHAIERSA